MWRQRGRVVWLKDGDHNTKLFHGKTNQRRRTNLIKRLKGGNGLWRKGDKKCETILIYYFSGPFSNASHKIRRPKQASNSLFSKSSGTLWVMMFIDRCLPFSVTRNTLTTITKSFIALIPKHKNLGYPGGFQIH
ncbi:unnamed protein product [Vicia faba]|uniref:Uncharacterized protein n=1 Tax=Vicia faba TaxID=3906 RepID=A0AAV1ASI1_VICFA|nr:unnamed protein product [Vicia faba]